MATYSYEIVTKEGKKKTSSIWSTHPSIEDRIEALRNIK